MQPTTADEVGVRYFSVAYKPLEWRLPSWMEPVSTRPAGDAVTNLGERFPELAGRDRELGEFATLFAVRRVLEEEGGDGHEDEMVGLSHYRRFAVTGPLKTSSATGAALRPAQFAKISRDRLLPPHGTLLASAPMKVEPTILAQYAQFHHLADLLPLCALAVDHGIAEGPVMAGYLTGEVLMPAPSVGVFPRVWVLDVLRRLEQVTDAYLADRDVAREGYQRRSTAFCLERLMSLQLLQLIRRWPGERTGLFPPLIVSTDGVYRGNDGSDAA